MEVYGSSLGRIECLRNSMECLQITQNVDGRSPAAWKLNGNWQKVSLLHRNLTEFNGRAPGSTERWQNLTESLPAAENWTEINGSPSRMWSGRKLKEVFSVAWKFDGSQIPSTCLTFSRLLLSFCATQRPSVIFHQPLVWLGELLSIFVNFVCDRKTSLNFC